MKPDKEVLFRKRPSGIYFHYTSNLDMVLINTVLESREGSYQRKYDGTKKARYALATMEYP